MHAESDQIQFSENTSLLLRESPLRISIDPDGIVFWANGDEEAIRVASNGDFFVRGHKVTQDTQVYEGLVAFLQGAGTYPVDPT